MSIEEFLKEWHSDSPTLTVHTSGSTGKPKPMLVEKRRMEASARITCQFLGLKEGDTALLCLPLDYIAGKMMVVRALTCGLRLLSVEPSGHPLNSVECRVLNVEFATARQTTADTTAVANSTFNTLHSTLNFAAMVPLQVWNSLQVPEERERLMQIKNLIIGGGSIDEELERQLKDFPNAVWSTYGMTETLSHIALRRLNGPEASEWYTPFEGVEVSLNNDSCLVINAPAVHDGPLVTNDIATLHLPSSTLHPHFRILGRKDNVICSGGIKIQTEDVERLLRPHLKTPFCITRMKDPRLGETVVLMVEGGGLKVEGEEWKVEGEGWKVEGGGWKVEGGGWKVEGGGWTVESLASLCGQVLPRLWKPRHFVFVERIPITATGKIARLEAEELLKDAIVYERK